MRFIRAVLIVLALAFVVALFLWAFDDASAHVHGCHTTKCDRRIHLKRAHHYCVKQYGAGWCYWRDRYRRELSPAQRSYAKAVRDCEKGDRPGDHSSFIFRAEWTRSTWHAAGGADYYPSVWEEDIRIVRWTNVVGYHSTRGWPNCP